MQFILGTFIDATNCVSYYSVYSVFTVSD